MTKPPNINIEISGQRVAPKKVTPEMIHILQRMFDEKSWPSFKRVDYLNELGAVAEASLKKETIEGHLASVLIYHQLVDELLKVVLDDSHFFVQCSVFPSTMEFPPNKKPMTGQLINELKKSVSFEGKDELISSAEKINKIRIDVVHKLPQKKTLDSIKKQCAQVQSIALSMFELFRDVHRMFHDFFRNNWHHADTFCVMNDINIDRERQ